MDKRYEEALERAKAGKPIDEVFPELKESEDERIRNKIIGVLEEIQNDEDWCGMNWIPDGIAYLEKQKEQKSLSTEETELNSIAFLEQLGYTCIPHGAEQRPTNSEKPKEWSEEDERMRQTAIEACKTVIEDYENSNARFYKCKDWLEYWLKSLRPQPHWKPSEEQIDYLSKAILTLSEEGDNKTANILNELRIQLKQL